MSESIKDYYKNNDHPSKGKTLSQDHKDNIGKGVKKTGYKHSPEIIERIRARESKRWLVTFPDSHTEEIVNLRRFCREHKLEAANLWKVSKGIISHSKQFKCKLL